MRYLIKSKRLHGKNLKNPEDFRWHYGYPDEPIMGVVNEPNINTKVDAFNEFAENHHMIMDQWIPIKDFNIYIIKSTEQLNKLKYD